MQIIHAYTQFQIKNPWGQMTHKAFRVLFVLALVSVSFSVRAEDIQFPNDVGVINVKAAPYNARGDGVTDDTAAIQSAIGAHLGKRGILYFPNGTYKVSNSLVWKQASGTWWARLMIRGQSRDGSIIKLADNSSGFNDKGNPKGVIITASENAFSDGGNNQAFQNTIRNITIDTGSGNNGAVGVDYVVSNQGSIKDVKIVAGNGQGVAGISMTRAYPGPGLIKNVEIQGFDYGIMLTVQDYSMTFSDVTLKNQIVAGMLNTKAMAHIYNLTSVNTVPVIQLTGGSDGGAALLIKANLSGGSASNSALVSGGRGLVTRDVTISGYGKAIDDQSSANSDVAMSGSPTTVAEYINPGVQSLFESPAQTLRLPVEDAPEYTDEAPANWANVQSYGATPRTGDSTAAIQTAMNSGKATVWLGGEESWYNISGTITIPATVRHIYGTNPWFVKSGTFFDNASDPKPVFKVLGASSNPLIVEGVDLGLGSDASGAIGFEHASTRTVVFRQCSLSSGFGQPAYRNTVTGGKLFGEDLVTSRLQINGPQQAWFRHLNTEYGEATIPMLNVTGGGAKLWILGWKVENSPNENILTLASGATAEILGLYGYMNNYVNDIPMIVNNESSLAIQWWQGGGGGYRIPVRETRDGVTRDLTDHYQFQPFYTGYKAGTGAGTEIPGKVEAESYTAMNGIQIENTSDAGGGQNVGYVDSGDWMDYTVSVTSAGTYNVDFRVASVNSGTQLQLKSGSTVLATVSIPNTGGWQSWQTVNIPNVVLVAGTQTLRVHASTGGWNLNWMNFASGGGGGTVAAPSFSPGAGTYTSAQSVTITSTTNGASARYTTDGSNPTSTTGTLYSGAINLNATTTLKAIAYKSGMTDSAVATAAYTISGGAGLAAATISADETLADQSQYATSPTMASANLTALGTTDWAVFGWNGSIPTVVNGKLGADAISLPAVSFGGSSIQSGYNRMNWSYTNGVSPTSATNQNLGGLGVQGNNSTGHSISFTATVPAHSSGNLYVWYAGFQGNHQLTAQVGSASTTDSISVGYDNVTFKRVKIAYTTGNETSVNVTLTTIARYSWNPTAVLYGAALAASGGGTAAATISVDETLADQNQYATSPTMANANLSSLGSLDWTIFGWNGSTPAVANRKTGVSALSLPVVILGNGSIQGGFNRMNWSYTGGVSPTSATNQNLGGLGVQGNNSTDHSISFTATVPANSSGSLYVWYAGFQGNHQLTAQVGSASTTDSITVGYNNVTFKRVKIAYTTGSETSVNVTLTTTARYSWNPTLVLYGAALGN